MPNHSAIAACSHGGLAPVHPCRICPPVVEPQLPTQLPSMSVGSEPQQSLTNEQAFDLGREKEQQRIVAIIEAMPHFDEGDNYWDPHLIDRPTLLAAIKERR
jgi:hypothetical protein